MSVPLDAPRDLNMSAAYAHVIADLIQSMGVVVAGCIIWWQPTWLIIDPICTFVFGYLVLKSTMTLSQQVSDILFEGVPAHINYDEVRSALSGIIGVVSVHDLHIWSLSSSVPSLSCHLVIDEEVTTPTQAITAAKNVCSKAGVEHVTVQIEDSKSVCDTACDSHM